MKIKSVGPAPEQFRVQFDTSQGPFTVEVVRQWAPRGADRFYELVENQFYDGARFFRVVPRFVVQFGINGEPRVQQFWRGMNILDDPVQQPNKRGYLSFASAGPNTRTTQVFINLVDNSAKLDPRGFAPFGHVVEGMETVDNFYKLYGDMPPGGEGPDQGRIESEGNEYLLRNFSNLDYIKTARVVKQ